MYEKVIVTGSLALDHIMSMPGRFKNHILPDKIHILNVSFIVDTFRQEFGGTGGNIAWTLGLLKTPVILVASAGKDFTAYKKHLARIKGIDLKGIQISEKFSTARGFVTTDKDDNQIWGFFEGAMKISKNLSIKRFMEDGVILMIAPNDPQAMIRYVDEAIEGKTPYIFDPAFNIPHFDIKNLRRAVKKSHILIGNDYEIELVRRRLDWTKTKLRESANIVITTFGPMGAKIESNVKRIKIPAAHPKNESDPTGAGDAFRAGFLAGYVRGLPLDVCGKMGAVAAVYTVERYGTQTHDFSNKEFIKRYKENYNENLSI